MQSINVAIDDYMGPFRATTTGRLWNGWDCPRFTFDVACDVAYAVITNGSIAGYDESADAFFTLDHSTGVAVDNWAAVNEASEQSSFESPDPDPAADAQMEVAPGVYLDFWVRQDDGTYGIGAMAWVWEDVTDALARAFVADLEDNIEPEDFERIRHENAANNGWADYPIDTNECMNAAFMVVFGRDADASSDNDSAAWNAAWSIALREHLTARI